jgi:hypothetical protein
VKIQLGGVHDKTAPSVQANPKRVLRLGVEGLQRSRAGFLFLAQQGAVVCWFAGQGAAGAGRLTDALAAAAVLNTSVAVLPVGAEVVPAALDAGPLKAAQGPAVIDQVKTTSNGVALDGVGGLGTTADARGADPGQARDGL